MEPKNLAQAAVGSTVTVTDLAPACTMRRRLQDLGFVPGTQVLVLYKSPAGDPVAYLVRGSVIALRRADSATIYVG